MREAWNPPGGNVTAEWMATRKGFIGRLAAAIRAGVENEPGRVPWSAVGRAMLQALDERHILIYVTQPDLAALLARQRWDGAIRSSDGDYLMLVDANFGYNKANASVVQSVDYTVDFATATEAQATLRVDYRHTRPSNKPCWQQVWFNAGITYQSMMDLCYFDYLRVYVPLGSRLLDSNRQYIPGSYLLSQQAVDSSSQELEPEAGKAVLAQFFVVESGTSWQTRLVYRLFSGIVQYVGADWQYSLTIQKQSGKLPVPTTVTVNLPPGAKLVSVASSESQARVQGGQARFEFSMTQDAYLAIHFRDSR
jgi:hypothetical protein